MLQFGRGIEVTHLSTEHHALWLVRSFSVVCNDETRVVRQVAYTAWPDHGVPNHVEDLLLLRTYINDLAGGSKQPLKPPLVVHCSAGVGRTGTYIAVDRAINQALDMSETLVDIDEIVASMRAARNLMVQTEEQYLCIYSTVLAGVSWLLSKEQGKIRKHSADSPDRKLTAIYDNNYHLAMASPQPLPKLARRSTQFAIAEEEEDEEGGKATGGEPFLSVPALGQIDSIRRMNPVFDPTSLPPSARATAFEPPVFHLDAVAVASRLKASSEAEATETGTDADPRTLVVTPAASPKMARQKRRQAMEIRTAEAEAGQTQAVLEASVASGGELTKFKDGPEDGSLHDVGVGGGGMLPRLSLDVQLQGLVAMQLPGSSFPARSVSDYDPVRARSEHLPRSLSIRTSSYSEALVPGTQIEPVNRGVQDNEAVGPLSPPAQDC